jgi:ribosomal protein L31
MKNHESDHRYESGPFMPCDLCSEEFYDEQYLIRHLITHHKEDAIKCDMCSKINAACKMPDHMKECYMRKHNDEESVEYMQYEESCLKRDPNRHNRFKKCADDHPYYCDVSTFCNTKEWRPSYSEMVDHMTVKHKFVELFICNQCHASFAGSESLSFHTVFHDI